MVDNTDESDEEDCPECGYYCYAMQNGGPCRDIGNLYEEEDYP